MLSAKTDKKGDCMKTTLSSALRRVTFFLAVISATANLAADGDKSNRTFLSPRSPSVNIAQKYTTWHDHVYGQRCGKVHTSFQLTGFYSESENSKDLGRYFGIGNGTNTIDINSGGDEVDTDFFIHDADVDGNASGIVSLSPRQKTWGARLDIFQDIHFKFAKFFIAGTLPIVHVERNMHINVADSTESASGFTLEDFFSGNVVNNNDPNRQAALTKAKIGGGHSETGVADIDLELGWKALYCKKYHLFLNLGFTIPTSNKPDGEFLFEPIYGNGNHFGLGFGIDSGMTLWCKDKNKFRLLLAGNYRFLFNNTQKRTVGLRDTEGNPKPFDHYNLAFQAGQAAGTALFPLANVLTQDVRVEPGSQIDAMAALSFSFCRFIFDAGYNLFWRERESVKIKHWDNDTFYIADRLRSTAEEYVPADQDDVVQLDELNPKAAATPSLLSHKIFASIATTCNIKDRYPFSFGIGGSYEFADTNADLENWAIWLKAIFSF